MPDTLEERIAAQALRYLVDPPGGLEPVIELASPAKLQALFSKVASLGFDDDAHAHNDDALVAAVDLVIKHSVHTRHPRFVNQNFAGPDPVSVVGDWLGDGTQHDRGDLRGRTSVHPHGKRRALQARSHCQLPRPGRRRP